MTDRALGVPYDRWRQAMFAQIITGKATDPQALQSRMEDWQKNLQGGADGWRATTAGVADDGTFVAVAMFESEEAAQRNSERPEQGEWWAQTEPLLENPTFTNSTEAEELLGGPDATAGFVQVIQARVLDADAVAQMREGMEEGIRASRPDVTGMVLASHGDEVTQVVYFSDEAAARAGETQEHDAADASGDGPDWEAMARAFGDMRYVDLREPWHARS
jgi:hypothetical protein